MGVEFIPVILMYKIFILNCSTSTYPTLYFNLYQQKINYSLLISSNICVSSLIYILNFTVGSHIRVSHMFCEGNQAVNFYCRYKSGGGVMGMNDYGA